jgi:hypothetical protein
MFRKLTLLSLICLLSVLPVYAKGDVKAKSAAKTADQIIKEMESKAKVDSESGELSIKTYNIVAGVAEEDKDESYNLYYKKYKDKEQILLVSTENDSNKMKITISLDGKTKKERFVPGKGYELVTTAEGDSNKIWGISVDDINFSKRKDKGFVYEFVNQNSICKGVKDGGAAYLIKQTETQNKNYYNLLLVSQSKMSLCETSHFDGSSATPSKTIVVESFVQDKGVVRPRKAIIIENRAGGKQFKAEVGYSNLKVNQVSDSVYK